MRLKLLCKYPVVENGNCSDHTLVSSTDKLQRRYFITEQGFCIIGRRDADLLVPDPRCSAQHALLFESYDGELQIRDLGSTNGTFINKGKISSCSCTIRPGDEIRVGRSFLTVLEFHPSADPRKENVRHLQAAPAQSREIPQPHRQFTEDTSPATGIYLAGPEKYLKCMPPQQQEQFLEFVDHEGTRSRISLRHLLASRKRKA